MAKHHELNCIVNDTPPKESGLHKNDLLEAEAKLKRKICSYIRKQAKYYYDNPSAFGGRVDILENLANKIEGF